MVTELEKSEDKYNCPPLKVLKTVRRDLLVERDTSDGCNGKAIALK